MRFDMKLYLIGLDFKERPNKNTFMFEREDGYVVRFFKDEETGRSKMSIKNTMMKYSHICSCVVPQRMDLANTLFELLEIKK